MDFQTVILPLLGDSAAESFRNLAQNLAETLDKTPQEIRFAPA